MKKITALILALLMLSAIFLSCAGNTGSKSEEETKTETAPTVETAAEASETVKETEPAGEESLVPVVNDAKYNFGVYYIKTADGEHTVSIDGTNAFVLDEERETRRRFTVYPKNALNSAKEMQKYYAFYLGDETLDTVGITTFLPGKGKLEVRRTGYTLGDKCLWAIEDYEDGSCRIVPKMSLADQPICLTVKDGAVGLAARDENDAGQLFKVVKADPHGSYVEFPSDKGNIFLRVHKGIVNKKSSGVTAEMLQDYANYMQEAYEAEIALTGYVPYDIIVISGWDKLGYVAGVSDNYNVINANRGFMEEELVKMAKRLNNLQICDLSFGMLHEMGHMFDSRRGWNFESEAWTDLKLCYVCLKLTEDHKTTDGKIFGCASADYGADTCFTYETMAIGLDIHAKKGAMVTVYGFFAAARLFLLMAYDFGWEPFIKTFHWYQDNGYTQDSFERWERFTTFVDKLSEFSGKDIKNDYLTKENWEVFDKYYHGETTEAV